jgi:hypothetical protein
VLQLNPAFQRRSVWKPDNRAFFLDTVIRGLPVPLLFIREVVNLDTQAVHREVVDGQQRLRSLFAYIDPKLLDDYDIARDRFAVPRRMNPEIADATYEELDAELKARILEYAFAVVVLPTNVEDRDVLEIFARLNSTGYKLNYQELRNAEFFGEFKSVAYTLALEQFERWRAWRILSDDQLSRMSEVQLVSDLLMSMIDGLTGRSQAKLNATYRRFDKSFPGQGVVMTRFRHVMDTAAALIGPEMASNVYSSEVHFFTLFTYLYDRMWGLGSDLRRRPPRPVPRSARRSLFELSRQFKEQDVPKAVLDAVQRASTDLVRRKRRLDYMTKVCG